MPRRSILPAVFLFIALCTLLAACTSGPEGGAPQPTTPAGQAATTAPPVSGTVAPTPAANDLTNQYSPLAAGFTGSRSTTPLQGTGPRVGLRLIAANLTSPMMLTGVPDLTGRLFIVDQIGLIRIVTRDGILLDKPFLDLRDRMVRLSPGYDERGLLSMTFHPSYENNGRFFVFYSAPLRSGATAGWSCTNRLSEFKVSSADPNVADPASERILLEVDKPSENHNGGKIGFGPEGYLYIPLGDGGGADDTGLGHTVGTGNAQDLTTLLGKVLRIDVNTVSAGKAYGIPRDNPFAFDRNALPEIFASGFRNPAYAASDYYGSHRYIVASAGQKLFESIYIVLPGGNYGWNIREGTHCFDPQDDSRPKPGSCASTGSRDEPLIGPIFEGGHDLGNTIVGGYLYRGEEVAAITGSYVFGYWSDSFTTGNGGIYLLTPPEGWDITRYPGTVHELTPRDNRMWTASPFTISNTKNGKINAFVRGFGQDNQLEIYVMINQVGGPDPATRTGMVLKLVRPESLPVGKMAF